MSLNKKHIGSDFDEFLKDEGIYEEVTRRAGKKALVFRILHEIKKQKLTMTEVARRMGTSRASLARILEPNNNAVTIEVLERAAQAVGRKIHYQLV
jgi:antitoxin HicB